MSTPVSTAVSAMLCLLLVVAAARADNKVRSSAAPLPQLYCRPSHERTDFSPSSTSSPSPTLSALPPGLEAASMEPATQVSKLAM